MKKIHINPFQKCKKSVVVQGDKSISHRAIIIGSLARGVTRIKNFLEAEDTNYYIHMRIIQYYRLYYRG